MKIAFITDSYIPIPNGTAVSIESLRTALTRLGHTVYIFAPDYPGFSAKEQNVVRLPALFSPFNSTLPTRWPVFGINKNRIKELQIDIVHSHYFFKIFSLSQEIANISDCPLVHTFYKIFEHDSTVKYARSCDHLIALSKRSKRRLQEMNISTEIDILPVGIFTKDFASYPPQAVKKRFEIPGDRKILLYPARMDSESEFVFLLKCFKRIWKAIDDVQLLVVGGGDQLKYYYELVSKQPFQKYVTFTGFLPKKRLNKIYGACDLTVYPKRTDPQPLVLLESMAAGTPVVAVKGEGAQDYIEDHTTGYLTSYDIEEFSDSVIDLLKRKNLLFKFKQNSRLKAKRFSTSILTRDLVEFYEQEITSGNHRF